MTDHLGPMACPIDGTTLTMSERQGIEIDYCPQCRGVWLDRGELDKIIERNVVAPAPQAGYEQPFAPAGGSREYDRDYGRHGSSHGHGHKGRRKSFLSELFD